MAAAEVPDFMTVEEAASVLRIGRTAAYEQARLYLQTDGREGLPVRKIGGLRRVPRGEFEDRYGVRITVSPVRSRRAAPARTGGSHEGRGTDRPRSVPRTVASRRRRNREAGQDGLPFAG